MKISSLLLFAVLAAYVSPLRADGPLVFVSSFAPGDKGAIHAYAFDLKTGGLKPLHTNGGIQNPFFLGLSPNGKFLYSNSAKQFGGKEDEEVAAFELVGRTGQLKPLNRQSSKGRVTCYVQIDATGRAAVAANYGSGDTVSFPVNADGTLGEAASFFKHEVPPAAATDDPKKKTVSHAHCAVVSPDNRFVYVADLGLNQVLGYKLDAATAKLEPNDPPFVKSPAGAGPRHLTFHPSGKFLYAINEIGNSVTAFAYDAATGSLKEMQTLSTVPADFTGKSYCADLKITPDGRFLYGTNRGHDSIAAYAIADDGRLTMFAVEPSLGKGPQNLAITADGAWLLCANMPGNNVVVFRIDPQTGALKATGEPTSMPGPSCIMLLP
jgi:6-phosphogluconolactonase